MSTYLHCEYPTLAQLKPRPAKPMPVVLSTPAPAPVIKTEAEPTPHAKVRRRLKQQHANPVVIEGRPETVYRTPAEAAKAIGVADSTVRGAIIRGTLCGPMKVKVRRANAAEIALLNYASDTPTPQSGAQQG